MNKCEEIVRRYREFYRAQRRNAKEKAILAPLDTAVETIQETRKSGGLFASPEALTVVVAAEVSRLMVRVRANRGEGKPRLTFIDGSWTRALTPEQERQKVYEFAEYFVKELFIKDYSGDRAHLVGRELEMLRKNCEFLYRRADDQEVANLPADRSEQLETIA
jgi:CRISPR-associated protein Csc3